MTKIKAPAAGWGALALTLLVVILGAWGLIPSDPPGATPIPPTSATGATTYVTPDADNNLSPTEATVAEQTDSIASHVDQVDESPPGAPVGAAAYATRVASSTPTDPQPVGGAQNYTCKWSPVRNHSGRIGKAIQFVVHETVSKPGSGPAIVALFDTLSFGASSDYVLEVFGRCWHIVSFDQKSWTQGAFNNASRSVEIVAPSGSTRAWWLKQPIIRKGILAALIRDNLKRMGSPLRWVDPVGCTPRAGWTDHEHLECGNDHCDVTGCDKFPRDLVAAQVASGVSAPGHTIGYPRVKNFGRKRRAWCDRLALVRSHAKRSGWTERRVTAAERYKQLIGRGAWKCRYV